MPMSKRYLSADERREHAVRTVVELCSRHDPATLTTSEVAERMGVTQGALFRHFQTKDAIWESVTRWTAERILAWLDRAATEAPGPLEALRAMYDAHIAFILKYPGVPRIMMGQFQHDRQTPARSVIRNLMVAYRERVAQRLEQARRDGHLRAGLDLDAAATQFLGTIQGLIIQSMIAGDAALMAKLAPGTLEIYMHGIRDDRSRA